MRNIALFLVCLFILSSCISLEPIAQATKDIEKAAASVQKGLSDVGKIDPLAINSLLEKNELLMKQVKDLQIKTNSFGNSSGVVITQDRLVKVRITSSSGSFRINGYVDNTKNWFWLNHPIHNRDISFSVDYKTPFNTLPSVIRIKKWLNGPNITPYIASQYTTWLTYVMQDFPKIESEIQELNRSSDVTFANYLMNVPVLPITSETYIDLNSSFLTPGEHNIILSITPVSVNSQGRWFLQGELISSSPQNPVAELIKSFTISDDIYPSNLNRAVPDVNAVLTVSLK